MVKALSASNSNYTTVHLLISPWYLRPYLCLSLATTYIIPNSTKVGQMTVCIQQYTDGLVHHHRYDNMLVIAQCKSRLRHCTFHTAKTPRVRGVMRLFSRIAGWDGIAYVVMVQFQTPRRLLAQSYRGVRAATAARYQHDGHFTVILTGPATALYTIYNQTTPGWASTTTGNMSPRHLQ